MFSTRTLGRVAVRFEVVFHHVEQAHWSSCSSYTPWKYDALIACSPNPILWDPRQEALLSWPSTAVLKLRSQRVTFCSR